MSAEVLLRSATVADLPGIVATQAVCFGTPQWSEAIWQQMLADRRLVLLAEDEGLPVGFVVAALVAGVASLESIGVLAAYRGRGVGQALGAAAMGWARDQGAEAMELEVRASNLAALRLYRRLGFAEQGRRRSYYAAPAEDAVLMGVPLEDGVAGIAKV